MCVCVCVCVCTCVCLRVCVCCRQLDDYFDPALVRTGTLGRVTLHHHVGSSAVRRRLAAGGIDLMTIDCVIIVLDEARSRRDHARSSDSSA